MCSIHSVSGSVSILFTNNQHANCFLCSEVVFTLLGETGGSCQRLNNSTSIPASHKSTYKATSSCCGALHDSSVWANLQHWVQEDMPQNNHGYPFATSYMQKYQKQASATQQGSGKNNQSVTELGMKRLYLLPPGTSRWALELKSPLQEWGPPGYGKILGVRLVKPPTGDDDSSGLTPHPKTCSKCNTSSWPRFRP